MLCYVRLVLGEGRVLDVRQSRVPSAVGQSGQHGIVVFLGSQVLADWSLNGGCPTLVLFLITLGSWSIAMLVPLSPTLLFHLMPMSGASSNLEHSRCCVLFGTLHGAPLYWWLVEYLSLHYIYFVHLGDDTPYGDKNHKHSDLFSPHSLNVSCVPGTILNLVIEKGTQ